MISPPHPRTELRMLQIFGSRSDEEEYQIAESLDHVFEPRSILTLSSPLSNFISSGIGRFNALMVKSYDLWYVGI